MARSLLTGAVAALLAVALLVPKTAHADAYLGSTMLLSHAPDASEPVSVDSVFWLTALANDRPGLQRYLVTQPGQILQFEVRGYSGGSTPAPIHFQDLRPSSAGTLSIVASSQAYPLPTIDGVWSFDPTNFCVQAGDYLGFNEEAGIPVNVFGAIPGSTTAEFSSHNGTMNGDAVTPTPLPNVELLMSGYEGTGPHASPLCGGIQGIELHVQAQAARVGTAGSVTLPLACTGPLGCQGTLALSATEAATRRRPAESVVIAQASFSVGTHAGRDLSLTVTAVGLRLLRNHHGKLAATALATLGSAAADTVSSRLTLTG